MRATITPNIIVFTFDIDWVQEEIISSTLDLLSVYDVKETFFCAHKLDERSQKRMTDSGHDIGVHPHFRNATIDTLKEKLAWLIEHPEERIRLGREGRKVVERYCNPDEINQRL